MLVAASRPLRRRAPAALALAVLLLPGGWLVASDAFSVTVPEALAARPLSVECVAAPASAAAFNVFVACGPKESPDHWELYTYAGGGDLSVYLPGCEPAEIRSGVNVCDGRPHHLAATIAADEVRMWVDGREVCRVAVRSSSPAATGTPGGRTLWLGGYGGQIGCDGPLDLVRITDGLRDFTAATAADAATVEAETLAVWRPAAAGRGDVDDAGPLRLLATRGAVPAATRIDDHFGVTSVGFAWQESDSRDDRWQATDVGPFLSLSLDLPSGPAAKALAVTLGGGATACFDTVLGSYRTAWTGGFLRYDPSRYGLIGRPVIEGRVDWDAGDEPLWPGREVRFRAILLHGRRTLTETLVGDRVVLETATATAGTCIVRSLEIQPGRDPLRLVLVRDTEATARREGAGVTLERPGRRSAVGILAASLSGCEVEPLDGRIELVVPAADAAMRVDLAVVTGAGTLADAAAVERPGPLAALATGGAARWGEPLETRGRLGTGPGSFVLDTVPLPVDNPWRALMFIGDHDFFPDGRLAVCTVHGDVWLVDGLDDTLDHVRWRRFATGLFQPLGLAVIDGHVHVLGRDRITRLVDVDGDGEADRYESFSDANPTSLGGHDYAAGLETDAAGNLYYLQCAAGGMGGLYRVSADGRRQELVADGFRNPNGLGVGPGDVITVAPQEGTWTPASCICEVRPGGFYGFGGPRPGPQRPRGYDPPLCWIPRLVDNSSGSQAWLTTDRYGPLADMPVSLSFGRCRILLVLRETFSSDAGGSIVQGGTVDFGLTGASGLMRGCIGPRDGLLWVSGTKGWVSSGVEDGCLQRLRPTGAPIRMPLAVETHANGLLVRFSTPLDPETAGDPGSWDVSAWDYRYSAAYGSADYSPSAPQREGHDPLPVRSATLVEENRGVFLELDQVPEAMQLAIRGTIRAADGTPLDQTIHWTVNGVRTTRIEPGPPTAPPAGAVDAATAARLIPGLELAFTTAADGDARPSRLAALRVAAGQPATSWIAPGPFAATFRGFIRVPISSDVRFGLRGSGQVRLRIGDADVLAADGDLGATATAVVRLRRGPTPLVIEYRSPPQGDAHCELVWSAGGPGLTPVPPQALAHDPLAADDLRRGSLLRAGREAFADHHCAACHASGDLHPALVRAAPRLDGVGARLTTAWLTAFLSDPAAVAAQSTMPHLLAGQPGTAAADIAAYLTAADGPPAATSPAHAARVDRGLVLWERLGCIGCHSLSAPADAADDRRSLAVAAAKYTAAGLTAFLASPQAHRPATTMPDFGLSSPDAEALAAFLTARGQPLPESAAAAGDPARGRELVATLGCGRCHAADEPFATAGPVGPPLAALDAARPGRGCLADDPAAAGEAPRWSLTADVRGALAAFVGDGPRGHRALAQDAASDRAAQAVATLRCGVCHARDGRQAELPERLVADGELGRPIERLPDLTWAGAKLRGDWTEALLAGRVGERSRPWLAARMPAFPGHAAALAEGLAAEHGLAASDEPPSTAASIADATALGGRLVQRNGGLDCRQCHGVGPLTLRQDNDAQGISFRHVRGRLRRAWYDRWMLDPLALDPATKMPRFTTDGTHTAVATILDGDARDQFAAIWSWLGTVAADVTLPATTAVVDADEDVATRARRLFHHDNLVAWCIVPFDARRRTPEERAEMLERLGFRHFAYDWRDEHVPEFGREFDALARHGVALDAFWSPAGHADALLETFRGRGLRPAFWVMIGAPDDLEQEAKVRHAADAIRPLCEAAAKAGCSVALYNHGGWGGEPENQIAVIETLGLENVGIVYNQHHGHDHLPRFKELLPRMLPHLRCLNLNGMTAGGDRIGKKILPLGQGDLDVELLRTIVESGYDGPIGILGHTADDAEQRLLDNLDGLDWIVGELTGRPIPKPVPRTK